jgi:hypothetical protein
MADLTATATFALAGIVLVLAAATIALVLVTRAATAQARADSRAVLAAFRRQVGVGYRPLLIDVLTTAPVPDDMGAQYDVPRSAGPDETARYPGPVVQTRLPGIEPRLFDPRSVFVLFEAEQIYISVPLRNVGRGLALIDGGGAELTGALVGARGYGAVQREHVPVGETTRVDLVMTHLSEQGSDLAGHWGMRGVAWQLTVPYFDIAREQRTVARLEIVCHGDDVDGPWLVERVEQESRRDQPGQEPSLPTDELPTAPPAEQTEARRLLDVKHEPITDVWGNPARPRRRPR